jgi:hypothetical protein
MRLESWKEFKSWLRTKTMNWNVDQLWSKAKLYMHRAFDAGRESDLFPFWATIALEFFGRSILAKINPCLIADPQSGENLLYACGFEHATDRPKSVPAKTVFLRIKTITETFTEREFGFVMLLMDRRNEELHSGSCPFEDFPNNKWLPEYYRVCFLLAKEHGFSPQELELLSNVVDEAVCQAAASWDLTPSVN